jgi:hypothetical protein
VIAELMITSHFNLKIMPCVSLCDHAPSPRVWPPCTCTRAQTLRFWNVFPGPKNRDGGRVGTSLLFPVGAEVR